MTNEQWLDVKQAALILGDVSPALVYRLYKRNEVTGVKVSGRIKLRRTSVEAYLQDHSNEKAAVLNETAALVEKVARKAQAGKVGFTCLLPPS